MSDASRIRKQRAATRAKVKAHRAKLRRQCLLIAAHPREADDQAFVDSIAWVVGDGAR